MEEVHPRIPSNNALMKPEDTRKDPLGIASNCEAMPTVVDHPTLI
jgi:hypothetical protein